MTDNRKSILAKVKALLAKTTENGCTEGEAMSALDKARQMMDAYDISDTELAFDGEKVVRNTAEKADPDGIRWGLGLCVGVATFCDCKVWGEGEKIVFFGLETDTVFASWLLSTLETYIRRQSLQFLADMGRAVGGETDLFGAPLAGKDREHKRRSFIYGCVVRIAERLKEAARERKSQVQSTGRDLVVKKNALVEDAYRALSLNLRKGKSRRGVSVDGWSMQRGQQAGDRANFSRPVRGNGNGSTLAIGRRS